MTDYRPKPGDKVLLTVRATYGERDVSDDQWYAVTPGVDGCVIDAQDPAIVRVEPAPVDLPTGFCARIAATVDGIRGVRLGLGDPGDDLQWRVHPGDRSRVDSDWYDDADLSDVVVLDPGEVAS